MTRLGSFHRHGKEPHSCTSSRMHFAEHHRSVVEMASQRFLRSFSRSPLSKRTACIPGRGTITTLTTFGSAQGHWRLMHTGSWQIPTVNSPNADEDCAGRLSPRQDCRLFITSCAIGVGPKMKIRGRALYAALPGQPNSDRSRRGGSGTLTSSATVADWFLTWVSPPTGVGRLESENSTKKRRRTRRCSEREPAVQLGREIVRQGRLVPVADLYVRPLHTP
ncbi:MAG: hypothetical protein QOF48_767 [Verrucomicrobiota bacterium]|jgi:hypothetical protein